MFTYDSHKKEKPLQRNWSLTDIVDLEYFMICDEELRETEGETALRQQDRTFYFSRRQEFDTIGDTRGLVRRWLAARRMHWLSSPKASPLPGKIWQETLTIMTWISIFFGLVSGGATAASLLSYSGTTAVNVSGYFAVLIGLQLVLLLLLVMFSFGRIIGSRWLRASLLCNLLAAGVKKLFTYVLMRSQKLSTAEARLDFRSALSRIKLNHQEYGGLYFWPAFILLQLFGVTFNLAALVTSFIKISLTDIAFGWQSTLAVDPVQLAKIIQYLATPWSWMLPVETAYPSLAQIEGSRIILKDGLYLLTTNNLVSWWPFLLLAVFTYGLLPRLVLLIFGCLRMKTNLTRLRFDSARFRQLQQRMLSPILETQQVAANREQTSEPSGQSADPAYQAALEPAATSGAKLLLIPDELYDDLKAKELEQLLKVHEGAGPYYSLRTGALGQSEEELYCDIARTLHENPYTGIILLQEAWQPPLRELLGLLRRVRHELPRHYPLSIALVGKPHKEILLTPAKGADLNLWRKTMQTLADPYLALYPLVEKR